MQRHGRNNTPIGVIRDLHSLLEIIRNHSKRI